MNKDLPRVFVDYNHVGFAQEFNVNLLRSEYPGLAVGDRVVIEGDAVPDNLATVIAEISDRPIRTIRVPLIKTTDDSLADFETAEVETIVGKADTPAPFGDREPFSSSAWRDEGDELGQPVSHEGPFQARPVEENASFQTSAWRDYDELGEARFVVWGGFGDIPTYDLAYWHLEPQSRMAWPVGTPVLLMDEERDEWPAVVVEALSTEILLVRLDEADRDPEGPRPASG